MKCQCVMPYVKCPYRSNGSCTQLYNMYSDSSCYKYYFNVNNIQDIPENQYIIKEFYKIDSILKKYNSNPYELGNVIDFDNVTHEDGVYYKHYNIYNDNFNYELDIYIHFDYNKNIDINIGVYGKESKYKHNGFSIMENIPIEKVEQLLTHFLSCTTKENHEHFILNELQYPKWVVRILHGESI